MQCKEINYIMMKYFDGDISEIELELLKRHNESCSLCEAEFNGLKEAVCILESLDELEAPAGFENRVMERIKSEKLISKFSREHIMIGLSVIGFAVFAIYISLFVLLPYVWDTGIALSVLNGINYVALKAIHILMEFLAGISIAIAKLTLFRNILLTDYIAVATSFALLSIAANMLIIVSMRAQQE